jgi:short-subunit dehydrogenase
VHFKDKVVWITGASSGIGAALARQLAKLGARLILTARNVELLNSISTECNAAGHISTALPADMLQSDLLDELTSKALAIYGGIDIVILNAGATQRSLGIETEMEVYRYLMELNFFAPVGITKSLLPHFLKLNTGHIIVLSSMAGLMGFPLRTGYSASKHALKGFFETLQIELKTTGLSVTIVSPGRIKTPISLNAVLGDGNRYGKMDPGQLHGIPVEECAGKIIKAIQQKKKHVIIARSEKILWWFWWFARKLYYHLAYKNGMTVKPNSVASG